MYVSVRAHRRALIATSAVLLSLASPVVAFAENPPQIEHLRQYGTDQDDTAADAGGTVAQSQGAMTYSYAAGTTTGTLPGQTSAGGSDGFVRKYDRDKNLVWTSQFGTSGNEHVTSMAVDQSSDQVYVLGYTDNAFPGQTSAGGIDIFLRKYESDGSVIFTDQWGTDGTDQAYGLTLNGADQIVVGRTSGTVAAANAGGFDAFIQQFSDGQAGWAYQYGTSGDDVASSIAIGPQYIYIAGSVDGALPGQTTSGGADLFAGEFSFGGSELWISQFGTTGDDQGGYVTYNTRPMVTGSTNGAIPGHVNAGGSDAILFALEDTTGTPDALSQLGSSGNEVPLWIDGTTASDKIYIGGSTTGVLPGLSSAGGTDAFIAKFRNDGQLQWSTQIGTSASDSVHGSGIAQSSEADSGATDIFLAGETTGAFPGFSNAGGTDIVDMKISQDEDSDNVYNEVDPIPQAYTDNFSDGVTTGNIEDRGTQQLIILDSEDTSEGLSVAADASGTPTDPAQVSICQDAATADLDPGDEMDVTCGSAIISVESGEIEAAFHGADGFSATTVLPEGNTLRFAVDSNEFTTPETNTDVIPLSVGSTDQSLSPGVKLIAIGAVADTMLRKGPPNRNEGGNDVLVVRKQGDIRSLVRFDGSGLPSLGTLRKATLVLTINPSNAPDNWGQAGRYIDVHRLTGAWSEGNGKDLDLPEAESMRGNGSGATWNCATDTDIENHQSNCASEWNGAENMIVPRTSGGFLMKNNYSGQATFDVTQDVLDGALVHGWVIKKREETKNGNVRFYSREGATNEPNFVPQLHLEFDN